MKIQEIVNETIIKGDFSKKGGSKIQTQNATPISMAQAFGSEGYNILHNNDITLREKPSYWEELEQDPIGEVQFVKVRNLFKRNNVSLPVYNSWEIFSINPHNPKQTPVKGPLTRTENMPIKGVFVIVKLPYNTNQGVKIGNFLVDSQGANTYIRFWRKI